MSPNASKARRHIRAIASSTSAPFSFVEAGGGLRGVGIDLGRAIAEDNRWDIDFRPVGFGDLLPTMASGEADMICSVFGYTPSRAETVAFPPPYYEGGESIAVRAGDTTAYATPPDLAGRLVAVVRGTIYEAALRREGITVLPFETNEDALAALVAGRVEAHCVLEPVLRFWVARLYPDSLRIAETWRPARLGTYHLPVRKDDPDLLEAVTASLARLAAEGIVKQILSDWGLAIAGTPAWPPARQ